MKIQFLTVFCLLFLTISIFAQNLSSDYKVISVNKTVGELAFNNPYGSPLENYVTRMHLWIEGKYEPIHSEMIDAVIRQSEAKQYSKQAAENLLSSKIEQIVTYKDSIALVFRKEKSDPDYYLVGFSQWEDGKWLSRGEDFCFAKNMNEAAQYIESKSTAILKSLRQYYRQKIVSTDTLAFVNFLKQRGESPKEYILKKLADYPLVIYGEIHRRQLSWDLLKEVAHNKQFLDLCNTVFMELPYHTQPLFDKLMNSNELDTSLILKILETEQQYGWQDKGEYEFICELWKINQHSDKKIRIIPVDYQADWDKLQTKDDWNNYLREDHDRDSTMAEIITKSLNINDKRHSLFIVGMWHAKKSSLNKQISAGTILSETLPEHTLFSIISHSMISDNTGWFGQFRYGLFDAIFDINKNKPAAFDLKDSPFGKEPFDALQDVRFSAGCGTYEDFYDGYIFLCPLRNEPYAYELSELYTDKFVEELKRRAAIVDDKEGWYDIPLEALSKETIIDKMKTDKAKSDDRRYFEYLRNK
jgi:hypothetical protein